MLINEYERRKQEIQKKIKAEETTFRHNPGELSHARQNIQKLQDELSQLELEYRRTHPE